MFLKLPQRSFYTVRPLPLLVSSWCLLALLLLLPTITRAQSGSFAAHLAGKRGIGSSAPLRQESPVVTFAPIPLGDDSTIQLMSTPALAFLGPELLEAIRRHHRELNELLGGVSGVRSTLRLIDAEEFYSITQLPSWTNAMFFRKQIVIPIDNSRGIDRKELERSLRHEYFHALTNSLSDGKCPGWLDEGLAQLIEGTPHPHLWLALSTYLKKRGIVPFDRLMKGFTKLPADMVAPAYAQSLVAAGMVKSQFGIPSIRLFFRKLREGVATNEAFRLSFGIPFSAFQTRVWDNLRTGRYQRGDFR